MPRAIDVMERGAPLRVALVYDDSLDHHGGIPQYLRVLSAALTNAGHEVVLLVGESTTRDSGGCAVHSLARNLSVRFNGNRLSMPVLADRRAIRVHVERGDFDVVHVQVPYSPIMAGQVIRRLPASTGLVGTFHVVSERVVPFVGARALAALTPMTLRRFDEMICVSEHAARFARRTFRVVAPAIVPNMVDLAAFAPAGKREPLSLPPTVVSLGALVPRKGTLRLVEAFARVRRQLPEARLVIVGDGPQRKRIERHVHRLGLRDAIDLIGHVAEADKPAILRSAQVLCFPAAYGESFGIVLLEGMASHGPPVVACANPGYAEVLGSVPDALAPTDPDALAKRLLTLLLDNDRSRRLAARQHALVKRYDATRVAAEVAEVYHRAVARRRGAVSVAADAA
jgi:phosphatidylinositol alpha-mannosyltransferase